MNDVKVGEYVRTIEWYIAKCINSNEYALDFDNTIITSYGETWEYLLPEDTNRIKAHSFNIIDLIECGDYVNGEVVWSISNPKGIETVSGYYLENDIKSIVTHEQFNYIKYVLGGKEEWIERD